MDIVNKYVEESTVIDVQVPQLINSDFIRLFVEEYRLMLKEKRVEGNAFLEELRVVRFIMNVADYENEQEFDLLFISYLALFKIDFPNIEIELHFENVPDSTSSTSYLYRLAHHNAHLNINAGKAVFKLFRNNAELAYNRIIQSVSYIPPLLINKDSLITTFKKKDGTDNFFSKLFPIFKSLKNDEVIKGQQRDAVFNRVQELYNSSIDKMDKWRSSDLSALYLIKTLSELYVLRHIINGQIGIKSSYQIGNSIIDSKEDRLSTRKFREEITNALIAGNVFEFNDAEIYIFSLIVQNSELFKIPTSIKEIYAKISPLLDEKDKRKIEGYQTIKANERLLKTFFIDIYTANLRRIIAYTKDVSFGLLELAKNIVEHSGSLKGNGFGIISARIYNTNSIINLKKTVPAWISSHDKKTKFLDINVIDSGVKDVISTYSETLKKERFDLNNVEDPVIRANLEEAYDKDILEVQNFRLNNLFNFDSLKLFHQINRTKSRLGLLIFSQVILHEKGGFINLASNNLDIDDNIGYFIYKKNNTIENIPNQEFLTLGTNLNFIIPVKESFDYIKNELKNEERTSSASSVFQELNNYGYPGDNKKYILKNFDLKRGYEGLDKYTKLEKLRFEIGNYAENEILIVDFKKLEKIVENSSDWIRFLAALQFGTNSINDIIIINFDLEMYVEMVNILKLFSTTGQEIQGFWKNDRFVLTFIPVKNNSDHIFWFNDLLFSSNYDEYRKINADIDLYHHNLVRITEEAYANVGAVVDYSSISSKLFSSNKKLLNFELIIINHDYISLFEQTTRSLLQIPIENTDED